MSVCETQNDTNTCKLLVDGEDSSSRVTQYNNNLSDVYIDVWVTFKHICLCIKMKNLFKSYTVLNIVR